MNEWKRALARANQPECVGIQQKPADETSTVLGHDSLDLCEIVCDVGRKHMREDRLQRDETEQPFGEGEVVCRRRLCAVRIVLTIENVDVLEAEIRMLGGNLFGAPVDAGPDDIDAIV